MKQKLEIMHYKNGRKAEVGDKVIGFTYNKSDVQVGIVECITPNAKTCNCTLNMPIEKFGMMEREYTQCDWLLHVDDAWNFIIGVAFGPNDQDYIAKIINFGKWNAPIKELPASERPLNKPLNKLGGRDE